MHCEEIEVYLSGYVDNELPQQHRQLVESHLQDCSRCHEILRELQDLKQNTSRIEYETPTEKEWKVVEKHVLQTYSRNLGWLIVIVWMVLTGGYGIFHYAVNPDQTLLEKVIVFSIFLGFGLIFFSVLMERIRDRRTDRYKGVQQ